VLKKDKTHFSSTLGRVSKIAIDTATGQYGNSDHSVKHNFPSSHVACTLQIFAERESKLGFCMMIFFARRAQQPFLF